MHHWRWKPNLCKQNRNVYECPITKNCFLGAPLVCLLSFSPSVNFTRNDCIRQRQGAMLILPISNTTTTPPPPLAPALRLTNFLFHMKNFIIAHDEERKFYFRLSPDELDAAKFRIFLRERGIERSKGYFWASVDETSRYELVVVTNPMLPAQPWWRTLCYQQSHGDGLYTTNAAWWRTLFLPHSRG